MASIRAGVVYFAIVFAAGFVLGTVRALVLAPALGDLGAVAVELPVILAVSWFACGWVLARTLPAAGWRARLGMGAIAFMLLMGAEFALAAALGQPAAAYARSFATASGALGLAGQIAFGLMPLLRGR